MPSLRLYFVKEFHESSDSYTAKEEALSQLRTTLQLQSKHKCDSSERKRLCEKAQSGILGLGYFPI